MSSPEITKVDFDADDEEIVLKRDNRELISLMSIGFAEYVGTGLLVFLACMGCTAEMSPPHSVQPIQSSLITGLGIMAIIQIFGHVSGAHINPAVTLCAVIMKQISWKQASIYITTQIAGSFTGYALLMAVTPHSLLDNTSTHCLTLPHPKLTSLQAICVEAIITMILDLAICACWDSKNTKHTTSSVGFKIGMIVAILAMAAGPYTGASMNPARSFGPALFNRNLELNLIYWIGPGLGACLAGCFYRIIMMN